MANEQQVVQETTPVRWGPDRDVEGYSPAAERGHPEPEEQVRWGPDRDVEGYPPATERGHAPA